MAKYGWDNAVIQFDNSSGTLVDISTYVTDISPIKKSAETVDGTTVGMAWRANLDSTLRSMDDFTITCFYDDTASTGPWVLFNDIGAPTPAAGRELEVTYGSTKKTTVLTMIESVERSIVAGELWMLIAVLKHFGGAAPTEA